MTIILSVLIGMSLLNTALLAVLFRIMYVTNMKIEESNDHKKAIDDKLTELKDEQVVSRRILNQITELCRKIVELL